MKLPFYHRFLGYYRISFAPRDKTRVLDLLLQMRAVAYPSTDASVLVPMKEHKRVLYRMQELHISDLRNELCGLPRLLWDRRHRLGIPIGALLLLLLLLGGTGVVWRVEVEGNEKISDSEIVEGLAELGFGIGTRMDSNDMDALSYAYRLSNPEIAYMSIYTVGTTAFVKVIETDAPAEEDKVPSAPGDLVACEDGIIYETDVLHGTLAVRVGQVVKKGDILVSGIVKGAHADILLSAEGAVYAAVEEELCVTVPLLQSVPYVKECCLGGLRINFFGKSINIFENTGKKDTTYGTIDKEKCFFLPNGLMLPFGYTVCEQVYYGTEAVRLSNTEAVHMAHALMKSRLEEAIGGGVLLSRAFRAEIKDDVYVLYCTVGYTKNIAERQELLSVP